MKRIVRTVCVKLQRNAKDMENYTTPKCATQKFGKAHRRPRKSRKATIPLDKYTELNKYEFHPGQRVSSNNYEYKVPGRMCHSIGKTDAKDMYPGGSMD